MPVRNHALYDAECKYVADIIDRETQIPRSLPRGSLLRLYFLSPNSRYSVFVGFVCVALIALFLFVRPKHLSTDDYISSILGIIIGAGLGLYMLASPLTYIRMVGYAIQFGTSVIGTVEGVTDAQLGGRSTAVGMINGSIRALVSYTLHGQPFSSQVFLDRPWVGAVRKDTSLMLLVDPKDSSLLHVVGVVDQGQIRHSKWR